MGLNVENEAGGEELAMTTGIWIWVTSAIYQERRVQEVYARAPYCNLQTLDLRDGQRGD